MESAPSVDETPGVLRAVRGRVEFAPPSRVELESATGLGRGQNAVACVGVAVVTNNKWHLSCSQ